MRERKWQGDREGRGERGGKGGRGERMEVEEDVQRTGWREKRMERERTEGGEERAETDIQHCIQHITNVPHSVLTGDGNAHSTLWHSYTDDHKGQLIADIIRNSDHITLNTNTPTRVPNTTPQQTSSPDITTVSNTIQSDTVDNSTRTIITTINIRHDYNKTDGH